MASFVSANGPSVTIPLPPEMRMRVLSVVGWSAATSTSTPACLSSSLYFITAATTSASGSLPASEFLLAFTNIMNLMPRSPFEAHDRSHPRPRVRPAISSTAAGGAARNRLAGNSADSRSAPGSGPAARPGHVAEVPSPYGRTAGARIDTRDELRPFLPLGPSRGGLLEFDGSYEIHSSWDFVVVRLNLAHIFYTTCRGRHAWRRTRPG